VDQKKLSGYYATPRRFRIPRGRSRKQLAQGIGPVSATAQSRSAPVLLCSEPRGGLLPLTGILFEHRATIDRDRPPRNNFEGVNTSCVLTTAVASLNREVSHDEPWEVWLEQTAFASPEALATAIGQRARV
jgi:hypothetical protein